MRLFLLLLFSINVLSGFGQTHKSILLWPAAHFNFGTKGLGADDAGFGAELNASLFSQHQLHSLVEGSSDHFFGDKVYYTDASGKELNRSALYSLKVGAQYSVSKQVALSATFGPAWHCFHETAFTTDYGFRFGATAFLGKQQRLVLKAAATTLSTAEVPVHYFSFGMGYRFL